MDGVGPYPTPSEVNGTLCESDQPSNDLDMSKPSPGVHMRDECPLCTVAIHC